MGTRVCIYKIYIHKFFYLVISFIVFELLERVLMGWV
jgi:hypothetical protein